MTRKIAFLCLAALAVASCTHAPPPQNSGIPAPAAWSQPGTTNDTAKIDHNWWEHFADPTLNELIAEAIQNNKTIAIAKARVEEARANRAGARAQLLPNISAIGTATRENLGVNTFGSTYGIGEADVSASWELDLFGGNQARTAAANALLQSEEAYTHAVMISMLAEVARNYFDMRNDARQIAVTEQNLAKQQKTYELIKAQQQGAMVSDFDVQRAGAEVSTTAAQIPVLKAAYGAAENDLNVLLGYPPGTKNALLEKEELLRPVDPHILVAAPAAVLANRPDVRAAERQFAASISNSRAAVAGLFPQINLLGLYGYQDSNLLSIAHPWSIGASLMQPVLDFGRVSSQIDLANAQQKEALLNYQQTVLAALKDMENALTNYLRETERNAALKAAFEQTHRAAELANLQLKNGEIGLLDVLVAERDALNTESALAGSDAALRKDLVNIYAAAGGGWNVAAVQTPLQITQVQMNIALPTTQPASASAPPPVAAISTAVPASAPRPVKPQIVQIPHGGPTIIQ